MSIVEMLRYVVIAVFVAACAPRPGVITQKYPSGQLRAEFKTLDGRPHGEYRSLHRNGAKALVGRYKDGVRHGVFYQYAENGDASRTSFYFRGRELWSQAGEQPVPPRYREMLVEETAAERQAEGRSRAYPPDFLVTDMAGPRSASKARIEGVFLEGAAESSVFRLRVHSQHYHGKFAGYVAASTGVPSTGTKTLLEAGAAYSTKYGPFLATLSTGVFAPLGGDTFEGYLVDRDASAIPSAYRVYYLPRVFGLRNTLSMTTHSDSKFFRAEGGVDFAVRRSGDAGPRLDSNQVLARAAVAAGFALGRLQAAAGLGYSSGVSGVLDGPFALDVSLQVPRKKYNVYFAIATPITGDFAGSAIGFLVGTSLRH